MTVDTETRFEDGRLVVTRTYEAPRRLVFEAWIETSKVQQWWGCRDCTKVESEIDPRVGGAYNHHMTIKGEHEVPQLAILTVYDPPAKLEFAMATPDGQEDGSGMKVTVDFTEVGERRTLVRLVHSGIPDAQVDGGVELREIVRAGWTDAFGKLAKFMASPVS